MALQDPILERADRFRSLFEDEPAFRAWYDSALPRVYSFILARCGGASSDALELTQETFMEAVRNRQRYDGRADPVTWLCAIARNKIADRYRRRMRDERHQLVLLEGAAEPAVAEQTDAVDARDAVLTTLRSIPRSQSMVLALHYLDGQPVREIARTIGRTESSVESLLVRGRESFRRAYRADEVLR